VPLRRYAITTQTAAVTVLFVSVVAAPHHRPPLAVVWVCLAAMTAGLGMFFPANPAIAQQAGRRFSGTASALSGGLPLLVGSMTTPLTGALGSQTVLTMATLMAVFFALAAISAVVLRHATPGPDDIDADIGHRGQTKSQAMSTSFA
jgi:DHA1 family bicyclomycin/chloramphenicol resistance-like MFS transporter